MENLFKIPLYELQDGKFVTTDEVSFRITYLKTKKPQIIRVVVNGNITKETINLYNPSQGYKRIILQAISDYVRIGTFQKTTRKHNIKDSKNIMPIGIKNIENYLLPIKSETKRDVLSAYRLINLI